MNFKGILKTVWVLLLLAIGCQMPKARRPLNKSTNAFLQESAQRNKLLLAAEQKRMAKVMESEKENSYLSSTKGFWYRYKTKNLNASNLPSKGDMTKFKYSISTLEGVLLYDAATLGSVSYLVDQEDLLPALREGIKIMQAGEVVVFLFPSYLCYSYQGDGDKVGINQPLRFEISLDTIIKKQTQ